METLKISNAYRVETVSFENREFTFNFRNEKIGFRSWTHTITDDRGNTSIVPVSQFELYGVVKFKDVEVSLNDFWDMAYRAYSGISYDPDVRAQNTLIEHEEEINRDIKEMSPEDKEMYISGYRKHLAAWLSAMSRCNSTMITGPANFNTSRNDSANRTEQKRAEEFQTWRNRFIKNIKRRNEPVKTDWDYLRNRIESSAETIHGINMGTERGSSKSLFVANLYGKVETYAKKGDVETVQKAIDLVRELNETKSVIITERNKFFKLPELAQRIKDNMSVEESGDEMEFKGGKLFNNKEADRVQLLFDEKPSPEMITLLKKSAFKWSPRYKAWQRQLTVNGTRAAQNVLKQMSLI